MNGLGRGHGHVHGHGHGHGNGHGDKRGRIFLSFGSNRNKPKLCIFRFFRKLKFFSRFVSVFRNRFESSQNKNLAFRNKPNLKINILYVMDMGVDMDMDIDMIIFLLFWFVSHGLWVLQ
jgi:hypothetical protein